MEVDTETLVQNFLTSILQIGKLEQTFAPISFKSPALDVYNRSYREQRLTELLDQIRARDSNANDSSAPKGSSAASTGENATIAVRILIDRFGMISSNVQSSMLSQLIEIGIKQGVLPAKVVFESILLHRNFSFERGIFIQQGLGLIERNINLLDYKGVRDVLKLLIDRVLSLPNNLPVSLIANVEPLFKVFKLILNRNSCLLPAYLVLDEMQKKIQIRNIVHWKFSSLVVSFIESFKPVTQLVTIVNRSKLVPIVSFSSMVPVAGFKLEPSTAKFTLKGMLPYDKELQEPQSELVCYILSQPYSRDLVCQMLGLTTKIKQRCPFLEDQLVELIINAMELSEAEPGESPTSLDPGASPVIYLWQHLSTHLIYFVLFHHASFPHMVRNLCEKLSTRPTLKKGREHLMWILLQFISGSIQKNPLSDFLPILDLYNLLYTERSPLGLPDIEHPSSTHTLAAASIWIHLSKKADNEPSSIGRRVPVALEGHVRYLQAGFPADSLASSLRKDYRVAILCNAYSTNQDQFSKPMAVLVEATTGSNRPITSGTVHSPPIAITLLDSLTVHTKMSLIHSIPGHITKTCQNAANSTKGANCPISITSLSPSFLETYSRLLIYSEIESLGVKGFMNQLCGNPPIWRQAPNIYHSLLEMFTYRLHHVPSHYRIQLLVHLNSPQNTMNANHVQLHLCMEHTAVKLWLGLSSMECLTLPQYSRLPNESSKGYKQMISNDSEELNKLLVLCLARAITLTHSDSLCQWVKEILQEISNSTSITWSSHTLACFPSSVSEFYAGQSNQKDTGKIKQLVAEEYKKWKMMNNENDIIAHFSHSSTQPLFLCLIWKMLLEQDTSPIRLTAYKILDRIGSRALSLHVRTFADFLVSECAGSLNQLVNKYLEAVNAMIWKCHIIPLDRLIMALALRSFEGQEGTVCLFIIQMILLKPAEFKSRVQEFCKENSADHWRQTDWHEKHLQFLSKFPEKFYFENLPDSPALHHKYIPVYFYNVCLRFLPVMDVVIHRFLEHQESTTMTPETILEQLGCLYKFHDRPITYLYGTLFYYSKKLQEKFQIKKKLVNVILGSQKNTKGDPFTCMLTEPFYKHITAQAGSAGSDQPEEWDPDQKYYLNLVKRLKDTMYSQYGTSSNGSSAASQPATASTETPPFCHMDWRFSEFVNVTSLAHHLTCVELLAQSTPPSKVANSLIDLILCPSRAVRAELDQWVNVVGTILTSLPEPYWTCLYDRIIHVMENDVPQTFSSPNGSPLDAKNIFQLMQISPSRVSTYETLPGLLIALTHATLYTTSVGQICLLPTFVKERVKPVIRTEEQFLFICQLVCPFMQRLCAERTRTVMDATIELYEMLEIVDKNLAATGSGEPLRHIDVICDLLYHIKYSYTGDSVKAEIEKSVMGMRPALQAKLRFIIHLNPEEVGVANRN